MTTPSLQKETASLRGTPCYFAMNGKVHATGGAQVRTTDDCRRAMPTLIDMALTERDDGLSEDWVLRLADMIRATREAEQQGRDLAARQSQTEERKAA